MNTSTILALSAIGLLTLYFANTSKAAGFLQYYLKTVNLDFENRVPILTLGLAIQNPSNTPFRVKSIVGTLTSNGIPLANVSAYDDKVIAASSETVYPLKFRLSLIGIATDIVKIFTGGGIAQQIEFKGGVNVNNSLQELEFKYTIG